MPAREFSSHYTGRFAPSPTGPLHFGSLIAAAASYLDAKAAGGRWLVRMEDLDTPRVQPGASADILSTLDRFGFQWDGEVMCQSTRNEAYRSALEDLRKLGMAYPCGCTRKEIADSNLAGEEAGPRYPGTCRTGLPPERQARAWRVRVPSEPVSFEDRLQGHQTQNIETYCGDFVVLRSDGLFAYQLAVVVDDRDQGVTDIVRGADLLDSTPRQIYLQGLLGAPVPRYLHVPVALNAAGQKLSKQTLAPAIDPNTAVQTITKALVFLGQGPPSELNDGSLEEVWRWATENWSLPSQRITPILPAR